MLRPEGGSLRRIMKRQGRELGAYSVPKRVEQRNADGTINVRRLDGECVERSNICSAYTGQIIQVPCGAGFRNLGAAGTAMVRIQRTAPTMWVETVDPSSLNPGASYTVTITGRGFRTTSQFEFLLPDSDEINPDITITDSTYISATEFELEITVAADADLIGDTRGVLAYDNPGTPI